MKQIVLYLLCVVSTYSLCYGDVTRLATEDRKALENSSRLNEVHSTSALPPAVLALCDGGGEGMLAEPGQKWNATDAVIDPALPGKRLIWEAAGGHYYVVHYERAGIAHTFHILDTKLAKDGVKPKPVWRAIGGSAKLVGVEAVSQSLKPTGERSGLLMRTFRKFGS